MTPVSIARLLAIAAAAFIALAPARGAELKIISAGALRGVLRGMIDDYARQSGHTFDFTIGSTGRLREVIAAGEPADALITAAPLMDELEKTGKMIAGSRVDLGRIGVGVVLREGVTKADVSTPEGVRQAIIDARRIAYTDPKLGGATYLHLLRIADGMGLAEQVKTKGVFATGGDDAAAKVMKGEADLAIVFTSEIEAAGAKLAAPLPETLQLWAIYTAAIPAASRAPQAAREFLAALMAPGMRDRWRAAGWRETR
jgi:molybdate transport system substrate-binding protein